MGGVIASLVITPILLCGQSPPVVIRQPHNVAYCEMGDLIVEYENADVPQDLARRFDDYEVSVGIAFNEAGQIVCGYQPMVSRPKQAATHVPDETLRRMTAPLCSSIRKWKFRSFIYNGKAAPVTGPVVVRIQHRKFVLDVLAPPCQTNPRPIERK